MNGDGMEIEIIYKLSIIIGILGYFLLEIWKEYRKYKYEKSHQGVILVSKRKGNE